MFLLGAACSRRYARGTRVYTYLKRVATPSAPSERPQAIPTTVRDASPRKVCRKFCEAASEKGKLALKHVQGLTCYCKRR